MRPGQFINARRDSPGLPRRDFLKLAGAGAAALALPHPAIAGWFKNSAPSLDCRQLAATHDLPSLPDWGPYSKKHFGISHIPDVRRGLSFDFSIFPLPTAGPVVLPSVTDPSGVHPWEAAPDLGFYSLRFETPDRFYCDVSFSRISETSRLVRMELVNPTNAPLEITLNCLAQLVFPPVRELTAEPIRLCVVELPPGAVWIHALDYADLQFATPRPTDNLVPDGQWRGEERCHDSVGGSVIAQNFGRDAGDRVVYRARLKKPFSNATLICRFRMNEGERSAFQMDGIASGAEHLRGGAARREINFTGCGEFSTVAISLGKLSAGDCKLQFTSPGGAAIALNGFALVETGRAADVHFVETPWHPIPKIESVANGLILKYEDVSNCYGFTPGAPLSGHRELKWRELDAAFGTEAGPNTRERIFGDRRRGRAGDPDSLFIHAFTKPFTVAPDSNRVIYGLVCQGPEAEVRRGLAGFNSESAENERVFHSARKKAFQPVATPAGEDCKFSQQMMAATTLTSLVYPLYTQRNYLRHYSPGRIWDCLYTWDAGFIGLGLLELDLQSAVEILNAYLTPPGSPRGVSRGSEPGTPLGTTPRGEQSAFIHHGSPVPVQIYLFCELWNRTQSRELLEYFYPRLRQYHLFLAGRLGSSTTRRHRDHLICTWDYFYNSGGWDDYPPQKFVHAQKLEASAAPAVNSSHTIRCAKLLRQAAAALGRTGDFAEYDQDIAELSTSLQKHSWDAASGYFGYVMHDENGGPAGILRDEHGVNFNMGLDGIYPLVAGICSPGQEEQILERLFSAKHLWMDIGITTVDQSAPYYSPDGYWNGSVWLAHQWFIWKTMLDLGRADLANRIAQTGLNLWRQATDPTHDCWENFKPQTPQGRGWHQFTSLSSPALSWFASLYTPGRLTCGFEVWLETCRFSQDNRRLQATLVSSGLQPGAAYGPEGSPGREFSMLACMNPAARYRVEWNGTPAAFTTPHDGLLQIQLPRASQPGELEITDEMVDG